MKKLKYSIGATINLGNYENIRPTVEFEADESDDYQQILQEFAEFAEYVISQWQKEKPANLIHFITKISKPIGNKIEPSKVSRILEPKLKREKETNNAI